MTNGIYGPTSFASSVPDGLLSGWESRLRQRLAKIGESFVQGHVQGLSIGDKQFATGKCIRGVVAGSCYLHDESYKGHANAHWRGIVVLNEVYPDGRFSVMDVTLTKLCQKYAGESLRRFLQRNTRAGRDGLLSLSRAA